jgi:DNA-binding Lrp family transcriptional regulator
LEILGKHGRISYAELATMVHRSSSAVRKRVDALLRTGIIERFTVALNAQKIGRGITATLTISPASRRFQKIRDYLVKMPYVVKAYHMTGKCGILALVQVTDIDELNKAIHEIYSVDGVLDVDACVALAKIK